MAVAIVEDAGLDTVVDADSSDSDLLFAAREGDHAAWDLIVQRYSPLIAAVARRYRLPGADAADVAQLTWTRLFEHVDRLRDPRALPGWISTTAARACLEMLRGSRRSVSVDPTGPEGMERPLRLVGRPAADAAGDLDADLLQAERREAVRDGLAALEPGHRELLLLLVADPPVPYVEISARLNVPVGSIGPTRARLLTKLRRTAAVRLLLDESHHSCPTCPSAA